MKFSVATIVALLLADQSSGFVPQARRHARSYGSSTSRFMAIDMPPAVQNDLPVIQNSQYGPVDVRYSDFVKLVKADRIEKVTFSADGQQLLGVDVDGARVKIEALPNDPDLLTELTTHKVRSLYVMR